MEEILDIQDVMSLSTMKQRLEYMSEYMNKRKKEKKKLPLIKVVASFFNLKLFSK